MPVKSKKVVKKTTAKKKSTLKVVSKKPAVKVEKVQKISGIAAPVFDITGKSQGQMALPKEIFGQNPNKQLLAQAVRVYFSNQSTHTASTKTRAEVRGGGRKPWRQKGTGNARAGSIRSPLWVGGGITFGPRPRNVKLALPQKMKKKALAYALSQQRMDGAIKVISNLEKIEPKTKIAANLFKKLSISGKILLVLDAQNQNIKLATRNIPNTEIELSTNLNAFKVLTNKNLIFAKSAVEKL